MSDWKNKGELKASAADSLSRIKAISFDLDDTLWSCEPVIRNADRALYQWCQQHASAITNSNSQENLLDYQARFRQSAPHLQRCVTTLRLAGLRALLREYDYPESWAEQAFEVLYKVRNEVVLYEGVEQMLDTLGERYHLAAITNGNADLQLIGLAGYFDQIYAADMELAAKPAVDMFHRCLADFDLPACALLHIGDSPLTDIAGGFAAGVQTLWFNQYNEAWPEHLPPPLLEVQSLTEIVPLLTD